MVLQPVSRNVHLLIVLLSDFYRAHRSRPYKKALFPKHRAVDVVHSSPVYGTFDIDGSKKAHFASVARIILLTIAAELGRAASVCVINVAQKGYLGPPFDPPSHRFPLPDSVHGSRSDPEWPSRYNQI